MQWTQVKLAELPVNAVKIINEDWMLITAGNKDKYNTMTASWGALGELWNMEMAFTFIRPQRYTAEFVERENYFSLSFFGGGYKKELGICGSKSGRDIDKAQETGLTPAFDQKAPYFEEASLVLICRKVALGELGDFRFLDPHIEDHYPSKDYHHIFLGAIETVLQKTE